MGHLSKTAHTSFILSFLVLYSSITKLKPNSCLYFIKFNYGREKDKRGWEKMGFSGRWNDSDLHVRRRVFCKMREKYTRGRDKVFSPHNPAH